METATQIAEKQSELIRNELISLFFSWWAEEIRRRADEVFLRFSGTKAPDYIVASIKGQIETRPENMTLAEVLSTERVERIISDGLYASLFRS